MEGTVKADAFQESDAFVQFDGGDGFAHFVDRGVMLMVNVLMAVGSGKVEGQRQGNCRR